MRKSKRKRKREKERKRKRKRKRKKEIKKPLFPVCAGNQCSNDIIYNNIVI